MTEEKVDAAVQLTSMLEKGLDALKKVLSQEVRVHRQDMIDLLNFEACVKMVIDGQKSLAGKSFEEILKIKESLEQNATN